MKQHPDSVNRDLEDEVAEAVEQQYAKRMVKPARRSDRAVQDVGDADVDKQSAGTSDDRRKTRGA